MLSYICLPRWRLLDLRFSDKFAEEAFVQSLEKRLLFACIIFSSVMCSLKVIWHFFIGIRDLNRPVNILAAFFSFMVYFCLPLCWAVLSLLTLKCGLRKFINTEILATSFFTTFMICVPWATDWIAASLLSLSVEDAFPGEVAGVEEWNDIHVVLILNASINALCIFFPIRMRYKWCPPIFGIISYFVPAQIYSTHSTQHTQRIVVGTMVLIFVTFCALCGAWQNEQVARQRFTSELLVQRGRYQLELQHESNSRILERLCDTLLHLDNNFRIVDNEPRFEALLLCSNRDIVRKKSFLEFLASDQDRRLVASALNGGTGTTSENENSKATGLVQVNLRDMHGREFPIYLYHASIYDLKSRCGHMVALVEVQERSAPVPDLPEQDKLLPFGIPEDSFGNRSSDTMSLGTEVPLPMIEERTAEVLAWIDMLSLDMKLVKCSAGFSIFGPICEDSNLASMLGGKNAKIRKRLEALHKQYQDGDLRIETAAFNVKLQPLDARAVEFSALCTVDIDSLGSIEETYYLPLLFTNVRCHYRRQGSDGPAQAYAMKRLFRDVPAISL